MKIKVVLGGSAYTYAIDADVKTGDTVMVPPPFWDASGPARKARVAATESDYDGPLSRAWLPPEEQA